VRPWTKWAFGRDGAGRRGNAVPKAACVQDPTDLGFCGFQARSMCKKPIAGRHGRVARSAVMPASLVELKTLPSVPVAVVRRTAHRGELSRLVPLLSGIVWKAVRAQQARGGRHVAIYWDQSIRLEVGVELLSPFAPAGEVVLSATPAGSVLTVTHFGPYHTLGVAHQVAKAWCTAEGRTPAGPNWEIYGHWQDAWTANPSEIRTDVCYQLTPV